MFLGMRRSSKGFEIVNQLIDGFCKNVIFRFGIGMGVGLLGGTLPAWIIKSIATKTGFLQVRNNYEILQDDSIILRWRAVRYIIEETIIEEFCFRGFLQGVALNRVPEFISKKILKKENLISNNTYAKIVRIFVTSVIFSYAHKTNEEMISTSAVKRQMLGSFIGGICLGCIKESPLGLAGAVGGHVANNLFSIFAVYFRSNFLR